MTDSLRIRLAQEQQALLNALIAEGACPPGYELDAVALTRQSLISKRLREVGIAWPMFDSILTTEWRKQFQSFAQTNPPPKGGPIEDGYCFLANWNHRSFTLPAQNAMLNHELKRSSEGWILVFRRTPGLWRLVIGLAYNKRIVLVFTLPW